MSQQIYTIGHSNHSIESFVVLLKQHQITALVDVRSYPFSRRLPHFCKPDFKNLLSQEKICYVFLGKELGAKPNNPLCYVDGKALYEKIAKTTEFEQGIARIIEGTKTYRIALMCAEKDPIICHRAILVCQYLRKYNLTINHILSDGELETHQKLEEKLLKNYGLSDEQINVDKQLSLFEETVIGECEKENSSLEMRLKKAYYQQGIKIAYQEKNNDN
ncbi:MAG: DUF488 domain-containing protein [Scytonematopsis contorta HA4267-MV1]|nr:DUF488 domain-containing protein [Scytonematopsis contorta HA4267-MV1]